VFEHRVKQVAARVKEGLNLMGGVATAKQLLEWAEREGVELPSLLLALSELLKSGEVEAPEGFVELEEYFGCAMPKLVKRRVEKVISPAAKQPRIEEVDKELKQAITYLNEYWSVGGLRFIQDMKAMGVKNPEAVLKTLIEKGYVTVTPLGVINATGKLPKVERKISLADFLI